MATDTNPPIVDRRARVDPSARLEPGVRVGEGAVVGPNVVLRRGVIVGDNAEIGEGTDIGAGSEVGEGAKIGRGNRLGPETRVGKEATVGDECTLEKTARVGPNCTLSSYGTMGEAAMLDPEYRGTVPTNGSFADEGCTIGPRARVTASRLGEAAAVGAHASVKRSTLEGGARAGAHSRMFEAEIGTGCILGDHSKAHSRSSLRRANGQPTRVGRNCVVGFSADVKGSRVESGASVGPWSHVSESKIGGNGQVHGHCAVEKAEIGIGCSLGDNSTMAAGSKIERGADGKPTIAGHGTNIGRRSVLTGVKTAEQNHIGDDVHVSESELQPRAAIGDKASVSNSRLAKGSKTAPGAVIERNIKRPVADRRRTVKLAPPGGDRYKSPVYPSRGGGSRPDTATLRARATQVVVR